MKTSILRYASIGMATMSLAGFAAASSVKFDTTGPDSRNEVRLTHHNDVSVRNNNRLNVNNTNDQSAHTGDVNATRNTSVSGDLFSGHAMNSHTQSTDVSVDNSSSSAAMMAGSGSGTSHEVSFSLTGPDSHNMVNIDERHNMSVTNTNDLNVNNNNRQTATSGNVNATRNTTVGGLSSGDAKNDSQQTTSVSISN